MPADLAAGSVPASPAKLPPLRVASAPAEPPVQPAAQGGTMSETAAKYQVSLVRHLHCGRSGARRPADAPLPSRAMPKSERADGGPDCPDPLRPPAG
jgi:hypothetical protein